ncbi:MAG: CBS domain-containing protein [Anaerolineae bacterium]|nr:CBS domain-containing protein [Anaerolineae bacterium]
MLVRETMTPDPIVVHPDTSFGDAMELLRAKRIRRLPVVDDKGALVGIVVEKDLLKAAPSPATTLSVYEIPYLLSKLKIKDIMTKRVITVEEDWPLEEAARVMVEHKIGCLPVVRGNKVIGIITETDIFRAMTLALGGEPQSLRVMVQVPDQKGELAKLSNQVAQLGGDIRSLVTLVGKESKQGEITMKVLGVKRDELVSALEKIGVRVIDVREVGAKYEPRLISSH